MANLNEAVQLIRQGQKDEARRILEPLLKAEPNNIQTWFWYVETCATLEQRIKTLEICLRVNPGNPQALQALQTLQAKQGVAAQPPSQPAAPPPRPAPAPKTDEAPEPAEGGHWQQSWGESKPAFDWDALEKDTHQPAPDPLPGSDVSPVAEKSRPKAKKVRPGGPSLPFHKVWLTALTTQSVDGYAALLDDPEAGAGRAFEWMAYAGAVTGLLMPILILSLMASPFLADFRSSINSVSLPNGMNTFVALVIMGLVMAVIMPIQTMLNMAITGWLQNLLAVLFGGKGTFGHTIYALAAYHSPLMLLITALSIIPVIGMFLAMPLSLYALILNVRALQASHKLTAVRALMVIFTPGILNNILCCLGVVIFWPAISSAAGA